MSDEQNLTEINITHYCDFCGKKHEAKHYLPKDWVASDKHVEKGVMCPEHSIINEWKESQCPGCVGGWGECALWHGFAFSYNDEPLNITEIESVRRGICPRRTNGTLFVSTVPGEKLISDVDLSEKAPTEAGEAFADAIDDYMSRIDEYREKREIENQLFREEMARERAKREQGRRK